MDLHKELNRLQQQIASETIDGACVYGIQAEDRPLISAFMSGLNRTRGLKFDHPGLGTTATRSGERLILQNDIGLTQAHILVIHVEPPQASLTCPDVHPQRLLFFQDLFLRFAVGSHCWLFGELSVSHRTRKPLRYRPRSTSASTASPAKS